MGYLYICLESIILSKLWSKWKIKRQREKQNVCMLLFEMDRENKIRRKWWYAIDKIFKRTTWTVCRFSHRSDHGTQRWRIEQSNNTKRKQSHPFEALPALRTLPSLRPIYHELHTLDILILISFTQVLDGYMFKVMVNMHVLVIQFGNILPYNSIIIIIIVGVYFLFSLSLSLFYSFRHTQRQIGMHIERHRFGTMMVLIPLRTYNLNRL